MKASLLAISLCMALLTSCAHAPVAAAPAVPEGKPLIADTEKLESVIYRDFDETWYVINAGDRGFSQVETALAQLHGEPCDRPDLAGCYAFSFTLGDTDHDLVLTSGGNKSYVNLDGQWYQTDLDLDIEQNLVKLLLSKGDPIPKEQWIHNPDYVTLSGLLRNNSGISGKTQTICYHVAPYEYAADIPMESLVKGGTLPELDHYTSSYSLGQYQTDGSLWCYTAGWHYESDDPSEYQQLTLTIWSEKPKDPENTDGMILFEPRKLTKTVLNDSGGHDITVYGDGTELTRASYLIFTLPNGAYCQIAAFNTVDPDDVMAVLRCLIDKGFEPDDYAQIPDAESGYSS